MIGIGLVVMKNIINKLLIKLKLCHKISGIILFGIADFVALKI
jgi:hypothetical protein